MVETTAAGGEYPTTSAHSWIGELLLRLLGAALQILATWAVVRALTPEEAGVYFRGFVIALGLSALLRGKYEIYMAQHIIGRRATITGIPNGVLLRQLARRMLLRSSLLCAVLLVVMADLDIQAPQLQTILQTYLPFVLAVPCVSLSSLLGEALRAANRTLGIVVAAYAVNLSMLLAVVLAPSDASLALYSWAFLLGSLVSAGVAAGLAWRAFPVARGAGSRPICREALQGVDSRELIGLARGLLLWGPLCVLAVWAPPTQMAQYAVAARTALIVDMFLPALNLTGCRETLMATQPGQAPRRLLLRQLAAALVYSSAFVVPLLVLAPATLALYGKPYDSQLTVYALLLGVQWANGVGRPAVRHAVVEWNARRIGVAVGSGAVAVVLICALGVTAYGALAAAAASLIGALIVNGRAIVMALSSPA
ncbi:MAG: hypothetical protein QOI88_1107 [Gammaproteobacteria bacterium]|jgi:hypothetical protein|nr:hypothetical protein [Gammaproteobacteria bacterium]